MHRSPGGRRPEQSSGFDCIVGSLLAGPKLVRASRGLAAAVTDATAEAPRTQALNGEDLRVPSADGRLRIKLLRLPWPCAINATRGCWSVGFVRHGSPGGFAKENDSLIWRRACKCKYQPLLMECVRLESFGSKSMDAGIHNMPWIH